MDDRSRKRSSPRGTQIDDLPSCLIMDILLRLPTTSLLRCRVVCKSWNLFFSDPMFVKLHLARSPPYLIQWKLGKPMKFYSSYCRSLVAGMSSEASAPQANDRMQGSNFTCINSTNGLLCLENYGSSDDEIYVYITIKTGNTERMPLVKYYLEFGSRSNQFKVVQINSPQHNITPYMARIYTIGDGTREWKSIGIAPSFPSFMGCGFLNGSIHWVDFKTQQIFYFNFDGEQFGSLPSPPVHRYATMGVLDGCLFFSAKEKEFWIMKEYGVEESWTKIFSIDNSGPLYEHSKDKKLPLLYESCRIQLGGLGAIYNPSFISLQDVAKGEQLTLTS